MKKQARILGLTLISLSLLHAQLELENVGLKNQSITCLDYNYGILAVGTEGNGVYWSNFEIPSAVPWNHIPLLNKNVRTVYPHKSGPIGWAIGIGTRPDEGDSDYVYCSYFGTEIKSISKGFDGSLTDEISQIDGFPDPTICGETFAAGGKKLYRRYFTDTTWYPIYELSIEGSFRTVKAKTNYPTVLAGGGEGFANHFLIKSYDKGDNWEYISPLIYVHSLDFTDDSAKVIYVTDMFTIKKSEDYGTSWREVFKTNNEFLINQLYLSTYRNIIYAAGTTNHDTGRGIIYYSELDNDNWKALDVELNNPIVAIDEGPEDWIYIATPDSGVYRFKNIVVSVDETNSTLSSNLILQQNYPNPFNPNTTIKYSISSVMRYSVSEKDLRFGESQYNTTLKVYDVLGREVAILVNEMQPTGNYEVEFDASELSSGIYYYRLISNSYTLTKKMLLLK